MAARRGRTAVRNPLRTLRDHGQSLWLDSFSRGMLASGELERLVGECGVRGVTSSRADLDGADARSRGEDEPARCTVGPEDEIRETIVVEEARHAADLLRPVYDASAGADGFVCVAVSPWKADDAGATIAEAKRLWGSIARRNAMIEVPATIEALTAVRALLAEGINVSVGIVLGLKRYREVLSSYLEGMEAAAAAGRNLGRIASVASFRLDLIDRAADRELERIAARGDERRAQAAALRGKAAIASARAAYAVFEELAASPRFRRLAERRGALPQRLLWSGTAAEHGSGRARYVDALVRPQTACALHIDALAHFCANGDRRPRLIGRIDEAAATLAALRGLGIDLDRLGDAVLDDTLWRSVNGHDASSERLRTHSGACADVAT
ncbi:MAG TPA: transaldolase family protein [Gammaproteobacteria bacterium]